MISWYGVRDFLAKNPSLDSVDGRHQVIYGAVHSVQVAYYDLALYTSSNRVPSIHFFQTKTLHLPSVIIDLIGHKKSRKTLLRDAYENKKKITKTKPKKHNPNGGINTTKAIIWILMYFTAQMMLETVLNEK